MQSIYKTFVSLKISIVQHLVYVVQGIGAVDMIEDFLVLLSVCHTVIPETDSEGGIYYNAASPDEKALVEAAAKYGYVFVARRPESVTIRVLDGSEQTYQILNVIEFTSTRQSAHSQSDPSMAHANLYKINHSQDSVW